MSPGTLQITTPIQHSSVILENASSKRNRWETMANAADYPFTNLENVHSRNATDAFPVNRRICICHMNAQVFCPECTFTSLFVIVGRATNHSLEETGQCLSEIEIDRHMSCLLNVTDNALKNSVNLVMYAKRAAVVAIRFISSSLQAHCHRLPDTRSLQIEFTVRIGTRDRYAIGEKI